MRVGYTVTQTTDPLPRSSRQLRLSDFRHGRLDGLGEMRHIQRREIGRPVVSSNISRTHPQTEGDRVQQPPPDPYRIDIASLHILDMVSNLRHELLSPLASITGYAETLLRVEDRLAPAERRDFLRAIVESSARLDTLLGRLLELAYMQGVALTLHVTTVDVWLLARQAIATAEQIAAQSGRAFTLHLSANPPCEQGEKAERSSLDERRSFLTLGDPQQLLTMLTHVLENAIKYSADGGLIDVHLEVTTSRSSNVADEALGSADLSPTALGATATPIAPAAISVRVRDQGIGVPEDELEAIFTPFRRVDTSLTSETSGLGIGLALCRHIVEAHGGAIWAERGPDKGSIFTILLPRLEEQLVAE